MQTRHVNSLTNPVILGLLASLCCLLWGSAATVIKLGYGYLGITGQQTPNIILFAGCRFTLAGVILFIIISIKNKRVIAPKTKKGWLNALLIGIVMIFLQYTFNFIGVANASGVNASVLNGISNMISILFACTLFRQERLTTRKLTGCVLGIAGLLVMNVIGRSLGSISFMGEGFMLISACCGGIGTCLIRIYTKNEDPEALTVYHLLFGGFMQLLLGFGIGGKLDCTILPGMLCILYLSALSAMAYVIWNQLLKYNNVSKVSIYGFLIPIFGVILSAIFLGEKEQMMQLTTWITLVLICLSIVIVCGSRESE